MKNKATKSLRLTRFLLGTLTSALLLTQASISLADVAPITTQGNKLLFGGQPGSISGNSLFWSNNGWGGEKYYNAATVSWLKSDWNSKLVRAAMGVEDGKPYLTTSAKEPERA